VFLVINYAIFQVLAESIDEFQSSSDDDFDDDDQNNNHNDFDPYHGVDCEQQSHLDHGISIDISSINRGTESKDLLQERDEDSQSINSVDR